MPSTSSRYLAISLPHLPVERVLRASERGFSDAGPQAAEPQAAGPLEGGPVVPSLAAHPLAIHPLAIVAPQAGALRIVALNQPGRRAGLRQGQGLAEARLLVPDLASREADPLAEADLLGRLAGAARRWTPLVALDGLRGLMLDVTGCAHLFGGEAGLMSDAARRLDAAGFTAELALAATPDAAHALARHRPGSRIEGGDPLLLELPAAALTITGELAQKLGRVGLKRIADLADRPRGPLAARFGPELLVALDRLLGRVRQPFEPCRPAPVLCADRRFAEPIGELATIERATLALARTLATRLAGHGQGARRIELLLFRTDGGVIALEAGTSRPSREPEAWLKLLQHRIEARPEGIDAGFGFDLVRLCVLEADRQDAVQASLDATGEGEGEGLAQLADRLGARLGERQVLRLVPDNRHAPEHAERRVPAAALSGPLDSSGWQAFDWQTFAGPLPPRPLTLFEPPEPVEAVAGVPDGPPLRFRWRRRTHEVLAVEGPERIGLPWWTNAPHRTRDYFRVEDRTGHRFWLYRDGLYSETPTPHWFLHGLFA